MAKLMTKAIGLFALTVAYANGAWAACENPTTNPGTGQLEVCVVGGPSYAMDLFGPGSDDVVLGYELTEAQAADADADPPLACELEGTNGPKVVVEMPNNSDGTAAAAIANAEGEFKYTLIGAVFADRVRPSDLTPKHHTDTGFSADVVEGGAAGDNYVVFNVEVSGFVYNPTWDPGCGIVTHEENKPLLVFEVPHLTGAGGSMAGLPTPASPGILVQVEVDSTRAGGFADYPLRTQTRAQDLNLDDKNDADRGIRLLLSKSGKAGLTVVGGASGVQNGIISPEARETLVSETTGLALKPHQIVVAAVTVAETLGVRQSDGSAFTADEGRAGARDDGDGAGVLTVNVTGDFRDGDMLIWDQNGNGKYDSDQDTLLDMGAGSASAEFDLEKVLGNYKVHYVPNGKDPLRSGSIATTFSVAYDLETNATPRAARSMSELNYQGAGAALLAYAIAPPSNPDDSNIRVRCDSSRPCQIYFACDGADGVGYFGKMDGKIGARMVDTVNAMELADIINADDADFMGRMSCEVIGSNISVQVLTRSGDALVNNTYVGGPLEAGVRRSIQQAAVATVVAQAAQSNAEKARCQGVISNAPDDDDSTVEVNENTAHIMAAGCEVPM